MANSRRPAWYALLAIASLVWTLSCVAQAQPVKRALLIGVDEYKSPTIPQLAGAVNDVERMRSVLVGKFEFPSQNVRVLKNAQATRANVLKAIREDLIEAVPRADIAVLHFSGHGSQVIDVSGDEPDGLDETIVVHDSRVGDVFDITDDEIGELLEEMGKKIPHITLIMDSCHSGSITRAAELGAVVRAIPMDPRRPPVRTNVARGERGLVAFRAASPKHVLIAGSRANELSHETNFEGVRNGALTYFLVQALQGAGQDSTYRDVMDTVTTNVSARFPSQHPEVDGPNIDFAIFGSKEFVPRPYVLVNPSGSRARVSAGTLLGLRSGSSLDVFPPGTRVFNDAAKKVGTIKITDERLFESEASISQGRVPANSRAVLREIRPPDFVLDVYVDENASAPSARMREILGEYDFVRFVPSKVSAHLRVRGSAKHLLIEGADGQQLAAVDRSEPELAQRVADRLLHWARWYSILSIDNPSSTTNIELKLKRAGASAQDPQPDAVAAGTKLTYSITNRSESAVHVIVLALSADGQVCVLFPSEGRCVGSEQRNPVSPGLSISRDVGTSLSDGSQRMFDVVKVIATTEWISPRVFQLGPAPRSAPSDARGGENALERHVRLSVQGQSRNLDPISVEGWATRQRRIEVFRPSQKGNGYALHFDGRRSGDVRTALGASRSVCGAGTTVACSEVAPFRGDDSMVEVRPVASRSPQGESISIGEAFDEAYRLAAETGAKRAEPLFSWETPVASERDIPGARGITSERHDPRAESNATWSLEHTRVPEAWAMIRAKKGASRGAEAAGIVIAHPDTGYLKHPEIWSSNPIPVWFEKGYDYYREDDDATDELLDASLLDNPAHGTGSSSAIISPAGCQLAGADKCPTGIAAGARLVPIRTGRSVVHFDTRRLTQAILDASPGAERTHVKTDTHVMSISMGGFPSWALWKAVSKAESRGYLIIAASGNYIGTVVWPARFESVIAVAATNIGCKPWPHTSAGPRIDFSAPGESVWRATIDDGKAFVTGMGSGTTYATANTAGIAALWFAYNIGDPTFEELRRKGQLVQAFRTVARDSAAQPLAAGGTKTGCDADAGWSSSLMGPGIIDAAALLLKPLPLVSTRALAAETRIEDLPLWSSLYSAATPLAVRIADYRHVFGAGANTPLEDIALFESELLHHYAINPELMRATDRVAVHGNRSADAFAQVRAALGRAELSTLLRERLARA